jgi:hypothetical protein
MLQTMKNYAFAFYTTHPNLYFPRFVKQNPHLAYLCVSRDTEIVIEGFPRCGNTFAVIAFQQAQKRKMKIAHHLHVPAQIRFATRNGIPTLVLIREPLEAISSLIVRHPERTPETCFMEYNNFYSSILPFKDKFVVSNFNETVNDLGSVTARLNERFGTSFKCFAHSEENIEAVFKKIDENNQILEDGSILQLAKPAKEKERPKAEIKTILKSGQFKALLKRAEDAFRTLVE